MFYSQFVKQCFLADKTVTGALEEMGMPHSTAARWKRGAKPRATTVQKVADFFGVPFEELMPLTTDDGGKEPAGQVDEQGDVRTEVMLLLARTSDEKLAQEMPRLREIFGSNQ